jgi:two-component system chemotaxis response regulator CheY
MASIIVVDDDAYMRKLIESVLQEVGHNVVVLRSGFECLERIAQIEPDIIITDICMPNMDGIQTIQKIKTASSAIKIIAMTSVDKTFTENNTDLAIRYGATRLLLKPFKITELIRVVVDVMQSDE